MARKQSGGRWLWRGGKPAGKGKGRPRGRFCRIEQLEPRQLLADSPTGPYVSYEATEGMPLVVQPDEGLLVGQPWDLSAPGWSFDLRDNFMVVAKPAGEQGHHTESQVRHLVHLGKGEDGLWTGTTGLCSSTAAAANAALGGAEMGIRFADAEDLGLEPGDRYYGAPIGEDGAILVRYTHMRDRNLNGVVDESEQEGGDPLPALPVPAPACPLTVSAWTAETEHGSVAVAAEGSFVYSPADGYTGVDAFSYTVTNQATGSTFVGSATVRMHNVAPIVAITGLPGAKAPKGIPVMLGAAVTDPGLDDAFTYAWDVTKIVGGTVIEHFAMGTESKFTFTPNEEGSYQVQLVVTDAASETAEARVTIEDSALPTLYWDPDGNPVGNNTTTGAGLGGDGCWRSGGAGHWYNPTTGTDVSWSDGSIAVFIGTAGGVTISGTVSAQAIQFKSGGFVVQSGTLSAPTGGTQISVDTGLTATINSKISNSGPMTKTYGGTLVLANGNNSLTPGVAINDGALSFSSGGLGSSGNISFGGGTLQWASGNYQDISSRISAIAQGYLAKLDTNGNDVTFGSGLAGSGGLDKRGGGSLRLNATNYYTGPTNLNGGVLSFSSGALGSGNISFGSGTLQWASGNTQDISARIAWIPSGATAFLDTNGNDVTLGSLSGGSGSLAKRGGGTMTINGSVPLYGPATVEGGTLQLGSAGSGGSVASGIVINSGATLRFANPWSQSFSGGISGPGVVIKSGGGTLTLSGSNTFTGGTTIGEGTVQAGSASALGSGGSVAVNGGTLDLNGYSVEVGSLSGSGAVTSSGGGLTINQASDTTFYGAIQGNLAVTKSGSGKLTLSGTNSYTGGTTVNGGLLEFTSGGFPDSGGNVLINSGGALAASGPYSTAAAWLGSSKIASSSSGALALTANESSIDMSDYSGLYLGAVGPVTYSGSLSPAGTTYRLGGGPGTLTISSNLALNNNGSATGLSVGGNLVLSGTKNYTGPTTLRAGTLSVTSDGNLGGGSELVFSGGGLKITADSFSSSKAISLNSDANIEVTGTNTATLSGNIGPAGSTRGVQKLGSGTLTLSGSWPTNPGDVVSSAGRLNVSNLPSGHHVLLNGGTASGGSGGASSPAPAAPPTCGCNDSGQNSDYPVRYATGQIRLFADDLGTGGCVTCGGGEGSRSYDNQWGTEQDDLAEGGYRNGRGWQNKEDPRLVQTTGGLIAMFDSRNAIWFDAGTSGDNTFTPRYGAKETLTHSGGTFSMARPDGTVLEFYEFAPSSVTKGLLKRKITPGGETLEASYDSAGKLASLVQESPAGTAYEQRLYDYISGTGPNAGRLLRITLQRWSGSAWQNVRKVEYDYYTSTEEGKGQLGDLKTAKRYYMTGSGWSSSADVYFYQYYTSDTSPGFSHGLKRVLLPNAYQKAYEALGDPGAASQSALDNYTCYLFEYDSSHRVTKKVLFGASLEYQFTYTPSQGSDAYNTWKQETIETRCDPVTHAALSSYTVYTNYLGQVLATEFCDPKTSDPYDDQYWYTVSEYGTTESDRGQLVLEAEPSAVTGLWPNNSTGDINPSWADYGDAGLLHRYSFWASGDAIGYLQSEGIQEGYNDDAVTTREYTYASAQSGGGAKVVPLSQITLRAQENGSDNAVTQFSNSWYANSVQPKQTTTTLPAVIGDENGSGTSAERSEYYDSRGNVQWEKDERGRFAYHEYDAISGLLTRTIEDVASGRGLSLPGDATGWPALPADGAHLETAYSYDSLGRVTRVLGPPHQIDANVSTANVRTATFFVYNDAAHETRTAQGYETLDAAGQHVAWKTVNPVSITKTDNDGRVIEEIEAKWGSGTTHDGQLSEWTATPGEGDFARWTKYTYSKTRLQYADVYYDITGGLYNRTEYGYDAQGRQDRIVTPGGTVTRTVFDARGLVTRTWVGTDDTAFTAAHPDGTGYEGTVEDTNMWDTDVPTALSGSGAGSLVFDGSSNYVSVAGAGKTFSATTALTISMWVKLSSSSNTRYLLDTRASGTMDHGYCLSVGTDGKLRWELDIEGAGTQTLAGTMAIDDGYWRLVTAVYDRGAGKLRTYVNDTLDAETSAFTGQPSVGDDQALVLGADAAGTNKFNGSMDDVRFYRQVLSGTQVDALFHQGQPADPHFPWEVAHWRFDEGSGTTASGAGWNNLAQTAGYTYDGGNDKGDGNLTCATDYVQYYDYSVTPNAMATANRTTTYGYDWRDRQQWAYASDGNGAAPVATYSYFTYDNLDRAIEVKRYLDVANDGVNPGSDGLIGHARTSYDSLGRVFRTEQYGVNDSGQETTAALTSNTWYDEAGNVIKSKPDGSQAFTKTLYDGLGRTTAVLTGYDTDEDTYAELYDSTNHVVKTDGDAIFEESEASYDAAGNALLAASRQRLHNAADIYEVIDESVDETNLAFGSYTSGKIAVTGSYFARNGTRPAVAELNSGVPAPDSGSGYVMYTAQSRATRFNSVSGAAEHLVAVKYVDTVGWKYWDGTSTWVNFPSTQPTDVLIASVTFSATPSVTLLDKTRDSFSATWFDGVGRATVAADYGTNNGTAVTVHSSVPPLYDNTAGVLTAKTEYNADGEAYAGYDAKNTQSRQEFDDAGRVSKTIQNYIDGNPGDDDHNTATTPADEDVTVDYLYNADGLQEMLVARNRNIQDTSTTVAVGTVTAGTTDGEGYLMYSAQNVHTRLSGIAAGNSDYFVAVAYVDGRWKYDNGTGLVAFRPLPTDVLVAWLEFGPTRSISGLGGTTAVENGMEKGYKSGGLTFEISSGNFTVTGTSFVQNVAEQVTTYVYGTDLGLSSVEVPIHRNDLLRAVIYPDSDNTPQDVANRTGTYDRVEYQYNTQGQQVRVKDQNQTVHDYLFDKLGRMTDDYASALGADVDGAVRRIQWGYEVRGMVNRVTSRDASNAVNEVFRQYNDFGMLTEEYQEHAGTSGENTLFVAYEYDRTVSGTEFTKGLRLTDVTYPNQRKLHYEYSSTGGSHDDALSRVRYLADDAGTYAGTHLAEYQYLGLDQAVRVDYQNSGSTAALRYDLSHQDSAGQYDQFDRFGRAVDLAWKKNSDDSYLVQIKHGYDRAGNRLWREDVKAGSANLDELYSYDGMYQLVDMRRGNLVDTSGVKSIENGTKNLASAWTLDTTGNWSEFKEDTDTDADWELDQDRVHNAANEIDTDNTHGDDGDNPITEATGNTVWADPKSDAAGNMTLVPKPSDLANGYTLKYDAWNRLVKVSTGSGETETVVAEYLYDGLNRRVVKKTYNAQGQLSETRDFYQRAGNQVLEERIEGRSVADRQYVWGLRYVDDLVLRDRDSDGDGVAGEGSLGKTDSALDERRYAMQDANWNVVAIADTGGAVVERYTYKAYGKVEKRKADFTPWTSGTDYGWTVLYTGRDLDPETGLYYYRARYYSADLGRFVGRDPIGYKGGLNLMEYIANNPTGGTDPLGLDFSMYCPGAYSSPSDWASRRPSKPARVGPPRVPGPDITLRIQFHNAGGYEKPEYARSGMERDLEKANEIWAQCHIQFVSATETPTKTIHDYGDTNRIHPNITMAEQFAPGAFGFVPESDKRTSIVVAYIGGFKESTNTREWGHGISTTTGGQVYGRTVPEAGTGGRVASENILMPSDSPAAFTAHELGHVLLGAIDEEQSPKGHLMRYPCDYPYDLTTADCRKARKTARDLQLKWAKAAR